MQVSACCIFNADLRVVYILVLCCRTMQKHMKQLSNWLEEEEVKGHNSDDEDIRNAKQEVAEVRI